MQERSYLFVPGDRPERFDKAMASGAHGVILDLEDAVAPDAKAQARSQVANALREGGYGRRECVVRINALDTPWGRDDVQAVARAGCPPFQQRDHMEVVVRPGWCSRPVPHASVG